MKIRNLTVFLLHVLYYLWAGVYKISFAANRKEIRMKWFPLSLSVWPDTV